MTKIEKFTMAAITGLMQNPNYASMPPRMIAKRAYEVAKESVAYVDLEEDLANERRDSEVQS